MKKRLLLFMAVCWTFTANAQVFLEQFTNGFTGSGGTTYAHSYIFGGAPYVMSQPSTGILRIVSTNAGGAGEYNHGMGFELSDGTPSINLVGQEKVRIRLKSDVAFTLRLDLQDIDGDGGGGTQAIPGDNTYHTYEFNSFPAQDYQGDDIDYDQIIAIQMYYNNDLNPTVSATVDFDWFYYGNGTDPSSGPATAPFIEQFNLGLTGSGNTTYANSYIFGGAPYVMSQPTTGKLRIVSTNAGGVAQYNHGMGFELTDGNTSVDLTGQVKFTVRLRSNTAFTLRAELQDTDGDGGGGTQTIPGDNLFHTYVFTSFPAQDYQGDDIDYDAIQAVQMYFNNNLNPAVSATVDFAWYYYGDGTDPCGEDELVPTITTTSPSSTALVNLTSSTTGGTVDDYEWDFTNNGSVDATTQNASNTYANGTYTVALTVYNDCGDDFTTTKSLTVSVASCTSITPAIGVTNTAFTGTNVNFYPYTTGSTPVLYEWDFTNDGSVDATDTDDDPAVHQYATAGIYQVKLTVTDACSNTYSTTETIVVTVCNNATLVPTISAPSGSTFTTGVMDFTVSVTGGTPDSYYIWDYDNDGNADEYTSNPFGHNVYTNGSHTVKVSVYNECGASFSTTKTFTVTCSPTVLTPTITSPATNVTSNPVGFAATVSGGTAAAYSWDVDNSGSEDFSTAAGSYYFSSDGTRTVELTVFDACGNAYQTTKSYTLACSGPTLTPTITNPNSSTTTNVRLTASASGGAVPAYAYSWDLDGDLDYNDGYGNDFIYTFTTGTHTIKVSVENSCGDVFTATQTLTVTNTCTPTVLTPTITSPNTSTSQSVHFTSAVSGGTATSYLWDFGGTSADPTNVYSNGTYVVELTVYDNCNNPYTTSQVLTVNAPACTAVLLTPTITSSNTSSSATVNLTSSVSGGTANSYSWDFDGDYYTDATTANPSHMFPNGTYLVNLTVSDACYNYYYTTQLLTVSYTCTPATLVPTITSPASTSNGVINFTSNVTGGAVASYAWDFDADNLTDATAASTSHTFNNGTQIVKLTVYDACGTPYEVTQTVTVTGSTGVSEIAKAISSTHLYPNPTENSFVLEMALKNTSNVSVTLSDLMGRQLMVLAEGSFSEISKTIDVSNLGKGMYTVNYTINNTPAKSELLMIK